METAKHFLVTGDDSRISNFYTGGFDLAEKARRQRAETDKTARILYGTPGQYKHSSKGSRLKGTGANGTSLTRQNATSSI